MRELARTQIAQSAARYTVPVVASRREFVEAGALLSYGPHPVERWRRAALHVDKLLKGANAAELPVEQPSTFELVINLKVAKSVSRSPSCSYCKRTKSFSRRARASAPDGNGMSSTREFTAEMLLVF